MLHAKASRRPDAEGAALEAGRHPGVVELVDVRAGTVRTRLVEGARPLADAGPLTADEIAGVLAAVAATLADLHGRGIVHGGVEAGHVLLRPAGPPVLCSLGRGGQPADDVAALGRLAGALLAGARPARGRPHPGPLLAPPAEPELAGLLAAATDPEPARRPSAAELAAAVHQRIPTARLPLPPGGPVRLLGPGRRRSPVPEPAAPSLGSDGRRWVVAAVVAVVVAVAAAVPGLRSRGRPAAALAALPPPAPPPTTAPPTPVRVWPADPLDFHDGVLTVEGHRYAVGRPGDVAVAADWGCAGRPTLALLRPATGQVFAFDGWPGAGADQPGRPVATVAGAVGLRRADVDGDGCADLEADRPGSPPVPVAVRP
ncbi:MAG TPA: hypothetical protein VFJ85_14850 [Acidimicrobiales bacterium]|nr:hypothetical protein [Acidimicrobiales bacterium]